MYYQLIIMDTQMPRKGFDSHLCSHDGVSKGVDGEGLVVCEDVVAVK